MAYYDQCFYTNAGDQATTGYYAVTKWAATTAVAAGALRRQLAAPAAGSERVFVAIVGGTTGSVEPTWVLTRGAKTTDNTVTWMEVTGMAAVNGDAVNTVSWTAAKAIGSPSLGAIIQRISGASYQICTTAGTFGSAEPAFSNTAGVTTSESGGTAVWTSLGVVGGFTGGQAPHARLANACANTWFVAGNTIYVGDNHAESQAIAISIVPSGSGGLICKIVCHNHSGSYPPSASDLTTGASVSTTGAVNITFNPSGGTYVSGLAFKAGVGVSTGTPSIVLETGSSNSQSWLYFDNCSFQLAGTASGAVVQIGPAVLSNPISIIWNNCTVYFGNAGSYIVCGLTRFLWKNTGSILASGSSVPTNLFSVLNLDFVFADIVLEALDLSQITTNFWSNNAQGALFNFLVKDCKMNAAMGVLTPFMTESPVQFVRSDSGATSYKSTRYAYEATETTETSITRVGGAADPTGQAQSRKIVTTANAQWLRPFKAEPYAIWNPVTAANVTVTVYGTINAGALPNNDDIWLECEYLGSSSFPIGTIINTTKANLLAANAAVASDSSTWNVSPFTAWNPSDLLAMTLSNSNLTATNTAAPSGVRAKDGLASGKYYWEIAVGTWVQSGTSVGFGLATSALNNSGGVGWGAVQKLGGAISVNNVASGFTLGTRASGDTIGIALDVTNNLCWFRVAPSGNWNGSGTANPATGVGGISIGPIAGTQFPAFWASSTGEVATANFGGSVFSGAVPSGFTSGWPAVWSPFKLVATLSAPQPGFAGYIEARVRAAKPSTAYYLDPKIVLS